MEAEPGNRQRFLTAEWRHLLMLNFPVEREVLEALVPAGTALDTYQGKVYVSVVGFLFLKTRLLGVPVPFHQDFEEVNLRFYVRRFAGGDWRRGVVFIKEIVPRPAIAVVARLVYNENYVAMPTRHRLETDAGGGLAAVEYAWQFNGRWNALRGVVTSGPHDAAPGSLDEFITEHYWGYASQKDGGCVEYQVEHPRWRVWPVGTATLDCDAAALYGEPFAGPLALPPTSAFVAEGSPVTVFKGVRI